MKEVFIGGDGEIVIAEEMTQGEFFDATDKGNELFFQKGYSVKTENGEFWLEEQSFNDMYRPLSEWEAQIVKQNY